MCRFSPLRVAVVTCFAVFSYASTVVHPSAPKSQPQEIWAAYWSAEPGWHTDLQVRNNYAKQDLTVQPVLKLADGSEIPLASVTIAASDNEVIDLNAAVAAAAPTLSPAKAYGSIVVRFTSQTWQNAFVNVMLHRMGQPIAFHFDGWGLDPTGPAGYESLWWLPLPTTQAFVLIANPTANATTAQVRASGPDGSFASRTIALLPGGSARLSVRDLAPDIT